MQKYDNNDKYVTNEIILITTAHIGNAFIAIAITTTTIIGINAMLKVQFEGDCICFIV